MKFTFTLIILFSLSASLMAQCISGDCSNGEGTYIFKDNSSYTGDFKDDYAEGYGVCNYNNGNKYAGHWKKHKFHGEGTFYTASGEVVKGIWEDGQLIEKLAITKEEEKAPKIWAVVIGVAAYNHMRTLQYSDDDAYKMYAFLKSPAGGAIPDSQIKILIDENATKQNIITTTRQMLLKADERDVVMFYFSGHGKEDCFLPYDFDGIHNKLTFREINTLFGLSKSKHKICIADACHSGGLLTAKGLTFSSPKGGNIFDDFTANDEIAVMVSSQMDEQSVESSTLRQSTFSHFLLKGMKGNADRNRDNVVTISELFDYVNRQVKAYTRNYQNPGLFGNYDPEMPISVVRGAAQVSIIR